MLFASRRSAPAAERATPAAAEPAKPVNAVPESGPAGKGHGFVNMSDRVGAIGGTLTVDSTPGEGTTISGLVPLG